MECARCQHENRSGRSFCAECGGPLAPTCSACGGRNEPGEKFCGDCGAPLVQVKAERTVLERDPRVYTPKHLADKILTSRSALEGERKQVTVLFADVKGSMELAEQVDPEEWHRILDRFFQILTEGVHRFEGTVNQYTGDGIMALFGAPIAHEDHAQRACYAALHLQRELAAYANEVKREQGLGFAVRLGLNSGEVVVGRIGDDLRMDYTAQGHTVGLAQRMEQLADGGRAYLSEHTAQLVEGYVKLADLGPFKIHGIREPTHVYDLVGTGSLRTRLDVSRARGLSRFVGRQVEMQTLEAALGRARAGEGQVVAVVAEAGVGKSRLCWEFAQRCRAQGITVYETHGVAHGKAVPLLPVLEYLRSYFGIGDADTWQVAREKIAGRVVLLDPDLSGALPLLFDFMSRPDPDRPPPAMSPEARQRQLFQTMKRLTRAQSRRALSISLIEDLHWLDRATEDFVENLVDAIPGTRSLILVNFRPEYESAWLQKSYCQRLSLSPLTPEAITELLRDLLGEDPSVAALPAMIQARTGGNAFFAEELVHALIDQEQLQGSRAAYRLRAPVESLSVPANVEALLSARIDRLPEREKQVLQSAAVIGKTFDERVLEAVAGLPPAELGSALAALQRAEFVYEQEIFPVNVYAFRHPLTQEVALGSQLHEQRRHRHVAAAQAIERAHPDVLDERAALLAHHWEQAGETLAAARWHRRAAEWLRSRNVAEAAHHWQAVRHLAVTLPGSPDVSRLTAEACDGVLNAGWRLGMSEAEYTPIFSEGRAAAEATGDRFQLCMLLNNYSAMRGLSGHLEDYVRIATEALNLAKELDNPLLIAASLVPALTANWLLGHVRQVLTLAEEGMGLPLELGQEMLGLSARVFALWLRSTAYREMGRLEEAGREQDQAVELARELGHQELLGWILGTYSFAAEISGDRRGVLASCQQALEIAKRIGTSFSASMANVGLAVALLLEDRATEALPLARRALEIAWQSGTDLQNESGYLRVLADAQLASGDAAAAAVTAAEATEIGSRQGARLYEARAQITLARALQSSEGLAAEARIDAALARALALVDATGYEAQRPFIHLAAAEMASLAGDAATRQSKLREAHRLFIAMGATGHAERLARAVKSS